MKDVKSVIRKASLRGVLMSSQQGPLIFLLRRKCSRLEVLDPKMWEKVAPLRPEGSAGNSACKTIVLNIDKRVIILKNVNHTTLDHFYLKSRKVWTSTHRISDFQVLALSGHIRNLKSVALLHFLQRKTSPSYKCGKAAKLQSYRHNQSWHQPWTWTSWFWTSLRVR